MARIRRPARPVASLLLRKGKGPLRPHGRAGGLRAALGRALLVALLSPAGAAPAADLLWHEEDWSGGAFASLQGVDAEIEPGLLVLSNHPEDMRFVAEPTAFQGIYALAVYRDTLYLGASPYPLVEDGADVIAYDYATGSFAIDYQLYEQGVVALKVYGDTLYIPGPDSRGGWLWGNIYLRDRTQWVSKETVPGAVHIFDLALLESSILVTGGYRDSSGKVWRSDDGGETFYDAYVIPYNGGIAGVRRLYGCETYRGKFYAQPDGRGGDQCVMRFDGAVWDTLAMPNMPADRQGLFTAWGDSLIYTTSNRMYFIVGDEVITRYLPFQGNTWCRSIAHYGEALYGGAQEGRLYRWRPETGWVLQDQLGVDPATEEIEGLARYYGRLYVSTSRPDGYAGGRLYVSAAEASGTLTSVTHDFGGPTGYGTLSWEGFSPAPEGEVRLQLRSGQSEAELEQAPFIGPDGTTRAFYDDSPAELPDEHHGDRFFQYRATLLCPEGLRMPWLTSVTLEVDSLDASAVAESEDPATEAADPTAGGPARILLDPPLPNPAGEAATLTLQLAAGSGSGEPSGEAGSAGIAARVRVLDPAGREIRSERVAVSARPSTWRWDLEDGLGRPVPAGVYWVSASIEGEAGGPHSHHRCIVVR